MKKLQQLFNNQSLRIQLIIWFLVIALIPLAWITYVTYEYALDTLQKQAEKNLRALGVRQIHLLSALFAEKERNASAIARESLPPLTEETIDHILKTYGKDSLEYKEEIKKIIPLFTKRSESLNYRHIILVDDDGTVVLSLIPKVIKPGINLKNQKDEDQKIFTELFTKASKELKPQVSPLFFMSDDSMPGIFIASPITDNTTNKLIGVLFFQLNNSVISQLVQNFPGLGNTGEVLIAAEIDSQLIIYSSFYEKEAYPLVYRIDPKSPFGKFVLDALTGKLSTGYVKDYRGQDTIVIGRKIKPNVNWAIITKVDRQEIISTFAGLKYFSWIWLAITSVLVTLIASYVARKISEPVITLTKKTKLMTAGDLTQRITIPYSSELGRLGTSFNEMASQLDHIIHHLDTLVAKRTEEIENKNTQLNQTIEILKETQNRLITQEKLASLGALTAGIAHEIKNPLNFVNNFAELSFQVQKNLSELIEINSSIPSESKGALREMLETLKLNLEKIYKHGKRADSIVHNMLQHSRTTTSEKELTDLNNLLDEYVDLAYHGLRAKDSTFNVKIVKNYDSSLPKAFVSPQEISRVFLNLLNNAFYAVNLRKKNPDPSYNPIVKVTTEKNEDHIIIKIWDNGMGIPNNIFPKLFTPFFTTKPTGEGTGLGLSLSYNIIVQGHNGMLTAKSEEGTYAEFTIQLPISEPVQNL